MLLFWVTSVAVAALAAAKAFSGDDGGGYNVPIPKLDAVTQQIDYNDPNRRPGSMGRQYTTDPRYVKQGDTANLAKAQAASDAQKAGILAAYKPAAAPPAATAGVFAEVAVVFFVVISDLLSMLYIYFVMFYFILIFCIMKDDLERNSSRRISRE
jgi:hypothetical protein